MSNQEQWVLFSNQSAVVSELDEITFGCFEYVLFQNLQKSAHRCTLSKIWTVACKMLRKFQFRSLRMVVNFNYIFQFSVFTLIIRLNKYDGILFRLCVNSTPWFSFLTRRLQFMGYIWQDNFTSWPTKNGTYNKYNLVLIVNALGLWCSIEMKFVSVVFLSQLRSLKSIFLSYCVKPSIMIHFPTIFVWVQHFLVSLLHYWHVKRLTLNRTLNWNAPFQGIVGFGVWIILGVRTL